MRFGEENDRGGRGEGREWREREWVGDWRLTSRRKLKGRKYQLL